MYPCKALVLILAAVTILSHDAEAQAARARQSGSGAYKFPASVGSFRRVKLTKFTADGRDAAASYSGATGLMTAYVYPARAPYSSSLASHFEQCRGEVRATWGRTRTISKRATSINRNGRSYPAMEELFSGKRDGVDVISYLVVAKADDRYVKFRFTSSNTTSGQAAAQAGTFIQKFPWPR